MAVLKLFLLLESAGLGVVSDSWVAESPHGDQFYVDVVQEIDPKAVRDEAD